MTTHKPLSTACSSDGKAPSPDIAAQSSRIHFIITAGLSSIVVISAFINK
jgi:hypothetical protein